MERTARKKKTKANALTSPSARRVSLCKAGANQTPLAKFKAEKVTVEKQELPAMIESLKSQGYALVSFAFKGDLWTKDAVDAWLADGGYTGYMLEGTDGAYVAKGEVEATEGVREISTDDGVVVSLTKTEEPAAEVADEPTAEDAGSTVQPVAKSAADPISVERLKSLYQVTELAGLIRSLKWLVSDMSYDVVYGYSDEANDPAREAVLAEMKAAGNQLLTAFASLASLEVSEMSEAFKSTEEGVPAMTTETQTPAETPAEKTGAAPAAEVATEVAAVEATTEEETPAAEKTEEATAAVAEAAVTDAPPSWAAAFMETVTTSVKSLTERVDALAAPAAEAVAEKTEAQPEVIPARKSADADEPVTGTTGTTTEKSATERVEALRFRSALGF